MAAEQPSRTFSRFLIGVHRSLTFITASHSPDAIAVANGIEYLVTWNFRHIANAAMRARTESACREAGFEPPVICTPNELMETGHGDDPA